MIEQSRKSVSRRRFLFTSGLGATSLLTLAACGDSTTTIVPASTTVASATTTSAATTAAAGQTAAITAAGTVLGAPAVISGAGKVLKVAILGDQAAADRRAAVLPAFLQKFQGSKVELLPITGKDWDEYFTKILALKAAGNTPDIAYVATEGAQNFASKGLATPLDDYVKRDKAEMASYFSDVHPALVEAMMYNGSLYELPADFNAANIFLNTKVLNDAGYSDLGNDWNKDKFYEVAKKMTKKEGNQTSVYGYSWVIRLWGSYLSWAYVNGGNLLTEERFPGGEWLWSSFYKADDAAVKGRAGGFKWGAPTANSAPNVEALEFLLQLSKEGITPTIESGNSTAVQGLLASGKLGMTPAGGFYVGGLKAAGMAKDSFDVRLFPKWKNQRQQFGTAGYVVMQDSKNKDLAWEFVKYIVSPEGMGGDMNLKENRTTPARRSMMTAARYADTGPKNWQVLYDTLDKNPDTLPIPAPPQQNQMNTLLTKYISLAMAGEQAPKAALDGLQKELETLFKK